MTDFSQLQAWHTDEGRPFSPVLFVKQVIITAVATDDPIYVKALSAFNQYRPKDSLETTVISLRRPDTEEIFQVAGPENWPQETEETMAKLKLTLQHQGDIYFLEDKQTFSIFDNHNNEKLQITSWRVDHSFHNFDDVKINSFLDTITWVYTSVSNQTITFKTQYAWKAY